MTSGAGTFSEGSAEYRRFRPDYPADLFAWLAGLLDARGVGRDGARGLAWDCATGNGQAAIGLARHVAGRFARVVATDASAEQIAEAVPHPRVEYRVARAEASGLPDACADLVTVAQALHWLDRDAFWREARRVLRPGGAIAVWTYGDPVLPEDAALDALVRDFNERVVGPYWAPERQLVRDGYRSIDFPFDEVHAVPALAIERRWTLAELAGYVETWSSSKAYASATGRAATEELVPRLRDAWAGDESEPRLVRWPISMRVGVV